MTLGQEARTYFDQQLLSAAGLLSALDLPRFASGLSLNARRKGP